MGSELLAAAVPPHVREVCARLTSAGHQAVVVGGCVRDVLLGRTPGDWDVATSARPEAVLELFARTIATGLQHGTVTVVMGKGAHLHVEVTTYRGEGAYSDARRPDSVRFGVPLIEDLRRRDLVVNAIAYDPANDELFDPFGGRDDLAARVLRAVGDPLERFTEDGLRVMRVVRFAAQLEFELEPATEASIAPALPSLAKVSRERVCVELRKMLAAPQPSRGLSVALRTGILQSIAPALVEPLGDQAASWLAWIDALPRDLAVVRLAALCLPAGARTAELLRHLKFSNAEIEAAAQLVQVARAFEQDSPTAPDVRRLLARVRRDRRDAAVALWDRRTPRNDGLVALARRALKDHDPLESGDLAVTGTDVMAALAMKPGPALGRILAMLLDEVLADPSHNTREELLARARQLELSLGR